MPDDSAADAPAPRMADVAARAGVSLATADRALNRRKGVGARSLRRVMEAAAALGYVAPEEAAALIAPRPPNIAVLLPSGTNPYLRLLGERVKARAAEGGRDAPAIRCLFMQSFDAAALAEGLRRQADWADSIAFFAIDHPLVRAAVEEIAARGVRLVTLVSDLPHPRREAFVGLDNHAVGRTAGYLMGRFCPREGGAVGLIAGSRRYRAHSERETAFLGLLEENFPALRVVGVREGHDEAGQNHAHAIALLDAHPDLVGIYNVGGASDGIARALEERGRAQEVSFIGHGLTADTRRRLISGAMDAVLNASPEAMLDAALARLRAPASEAPQPALPIEIILRENLPDLG